MPTKAQRDLIFSKINYAPTEGQDKIHASTSRIRLVSGGERGGKSKVTTEPKFAVIFSKSLKRVFATFMKQFKFSSNARLLRW